MRHPIYLGLGLLTCFYLTFANLRGWSFWKTLSPGRWIPGGSGFHHK